MLTQRKMSSSRQDSSENVLEETASIATKINEINRRPSILCNFGDLPSWLQDNHDILKGYRNPNLSYVKCVRSLFYFHNESVNIWSHLLGAIAFLALGFLTYFNTLAHNPSLKTWDFFVFYTFLLGATICLLFSSIFHTLSCHSEKVCANWNRCDYIGIVTLIVGSFYPMVFYGFYCDSVLQITYLSTISIFGAATIVVSVRLIRPQYRWIRTSLFLALGLSAIVPLVHALVMYGYELCFDVISLKWLLIMGSLYVTGAVIYGSRIPERWYPGVFDFVGSSHQIFHVFVIAAAVIHYIGVISAMTYWHKHNHECKINISEMKPIAYFH